MRNLYIKISFILCALLLSVNSAWGATVSFPGKGTTSVTQDGITFSLGGDFHDGNSFSDYYFNDKNKESYFSWTVPTGYTINVSQMTIDAKYFYAAIVSTGSGTGQYKTSKNSTYSTFCSSKNWTSATLKGDSYFGLGNKGKIYIKAVSKELDYKNVVITYTKTANKHDVILNPNGGSGGNQVVRATYDAAMPTTLKAGGAVVAPTKTGYALDGYYDATSEGTKYYNGDMTSARTWNKDEGATLWARWTANNYTITLDNQSATTTGTESIAVTYDSNTNLISITKPTKTGYTFHGYYTSKNGGGTRLIDENGNVLASVSPYTDASRNWKYTNGVTLYAYWTANTCTITLNNQSATISGTTSIDATYDAVVPAITIPEKTNCTFEGYYTAVKGGGVQIINKDGSIIASVSGYTDGSKNWKYADGSTLTLYAYWKQNQTIRWDLDDSEGVEYTTGTAMGAVAYGDFDGTPSGLAITYTTSDASIATIVDGKLNVLIPNAEVTIYASQGGNRDYNATAEPPVSKTFTTAGCTPNVDSATALDITYGQTLASSTISGTVTAGGVPVDGEFTWVDPTTAPNAGNEQSFPVIFTPANTAVYGSVSLSITINVRKATPSLTWNITDVLRERVKYGRFVESSNKSSELEFATSNATLLNVNTDGPVLTTGSVDNITDGWIKVRQAASDNYDALDWQIFNVHVYPKNKKGACLPFDPMTGSDYNNALKATVDNVNWCNTNEQGFHDDYVGNVDVYYTQAVGIALGSYTEGLDGLLDAIWYFITHPSSWSDYQFGYSAKTVELSFAGIPDKISFNVESQTVTSVGHVFNRDISVPWPATAKNWELDESADGVTYTRITTFTSEDGGVSDLQLRESTRFVKITYHGNFTGYVKNLRITQKKYLREKNNVSALVFGTATKPLQEPQTLTLSYSSLGDCAGDDDYIEVTSNNAAFYVDEPRITENVGLEQKGEFVVRVRCNDVGQTGVLTFRSNDGTELLINVRSNTPAISSTGTAIFQTGTEHAPLSGTAYRAQRTHDFSACFEGGQPKFDFLYIYGVSESTAADRAWEYSAAKGYKVPAVTASNVHTPCFIYRKEGARYTYVSTFDAATTTLNIADGDSRVLVGYRPAGPAATAIQLAADAKVALNNTEILASGAVMAINGNATVSANGENIISSASNAAIQLSGATTLTIEDSWKAGEASGILALRPATSYPSIDLGSAEGAVVVNGTQLELHNGTHLAIAHMAGAEEQFDGEVHINDGSVGGETTLGMPKRTFIDGGTFNDGTVAAYTLKGVAKRPRNSRGEMLSRYTMSPAALASGYAWYGQMHLTPDGVAKVNPMLMDEDVWIFNGADGEDYSDEYSWNKDGLPTEDDDVLINAPMVIAGGEMKVKSLTINWENKGKGIPAVTVNPDGGLTVGEGGIDGIKVNMVNNLALKAGAEGATKGQTGFLRIHPNSAEPMPEATVEFYSTTWYNRANELGNTTRFQCIGTPIEDAGVIASTIFPTGTFLYAWDESKEKWVSSRTKVLEPFKGYDVTQRIEDAGHLFTYTGKLVEPQTKVIPLSYTEGKGLNLLANSFAAPISIEKFKNGDYFVNAEQTIYILNAGTKEESLAQKGGKDAAGKWVGIPIKLASELKGEGYPSVIPAMQGFWVQAKDAGASISLNYGQHIWEDVEYKDVTGNQPLRAPRAISEENEVMSFSGKLQIDVYTETDADCLFMLESERFDAAYEEGYDARRISSEALDIFTIRENDQLSIDATNSLIGTHVGVRTGEETMYTFFFSHLNSEKELALLDWETEQITEITENAEYTFFAEPNSMITDRFEIIEWDGSNKPGIATGVENVENGTKVHKFIKDNQLFILKNGVLYNATGVLVR